MDTAYKSRAWWMLRALGYTADCYGGDGERYTGADPRQIQIWEAEAVKAGLAAVAPSDDPRLTRFSVDRQGNTLAA